MIIGIDIGGTHFRVGVVTENNEVRNFEKFKTELILRSGDVLADLAAVLKDYSADLPVEAVAIGFPATLDRQRKTVLQAPNLKFMENLPVVDYLRDALQVPVFAERDVTFALCYDVQKYRVPLEGIVTGFYFGTGIGNALLVNGVPLTGKNGTAGELGHIPVVGDTTPCGCGNVGCLETLAGGKYLAQLQKQAFSATPIGRMFTEHRDDPGLKAFVDNMAVSVATEINILDPDVALVGGGVANMPDFPREYLNERILAHTRKPYPAQSLHVIYTADEPEKSVVGGAIYARRKMEA